MYIHTYLDISASLSLSIHIHICVSLSLYIYIYIYICVVYSARGQMTCTGALHTVLSCEMARYGGCNMT